MRPSAPLRFHRAALQAGLTTLVPVNTHLFSGDTQGNIKVWELSSGHSQTISRAHASAIMAMLPWDAFLISASLDGTIQVRQFMNPPTAGMVVKPEAEYTFTLHDEPGGSGGGGGYRPPHSGGRGGRGDGPPGILAMTATTDMQQNQVLLVSYNGEPGIHMYQLPRMEFRGVLPDVENARTIAVLPCQPGAPAPGVIITGDVNGKIKVFQWKPPPPPRGMV